MSRPQSGFIPTYNSLTDKHLAGYFSNTRMRRHLQRSGLISRSGRIISEKEYQRNEVRKNHLRHLKETLTRTIFFKILDLKRRQQLEWMKKPESSVRMEKWQKIKMEHSRKLLGGGTPAYMPHPPHCPRNRHGLHLSVPGEPAGQSHLSSGGLHRPSVHPNVLVTMVFLGKNLQLAHPDTQHRDEIKVYQQHCGGGNLCVYTGMLLEKEAFQFTSRRHHGFPFSLTFFLNGMQVDRLSCCCEFKLQKRSRLGGSRGYFGFLHVEGASPCSRCDVDSSLDQKPSPPKKKAEESHEGKPVEPLGDGVQDGALLAEGRRTPEEQKAAGTEEAGEEMALPGGLLPKEDVVAVLQVEEAAPGQSSEAGEDAREMGAPQPFVSLD